MLDKLYTILEKSNDKIVLRLSDEMHPIFQAHFPNHPVLPGFSLIDIVAETLNDKVIYIKQSKFIAQLFPNDVLSCQIITKQNQRNIQIFKNKQKVSLISYERK